MSRDFKIWLNKAELECLQEGEEITKETEVGFIDIEVREWNKN